MQFPNPPVILITLPNTGEGMVWTFGSADHCSLLLDCQCCRNDNLTATIGHTQEEKYHNVKSVRNFLLMSVLPVAAYTMYTYQLL